MICPESKEFIVRRIFLFFAAALFFVLSGCALFGGGADDEAETAQFEEEASDFTEDEEEGEGEEDFDEEGEEEGGEDYDEEGEGEDYGEEEEEEGEEKKGFFARLFDWGGDDDDEEEEESFDDEGDYDEGEGEDFDDYGEGEESPGGESGDEGEEAGADDVAAGYDETGEEGEGAAPDAGDADTGGEGSDDVSQEEAPPQFIPLRKTLRAAYRKGAHLVNAVYIAREGDTVASVSQKIYGEDRSPALYEINSHLRDRSVTVGDKIYYSSKIRPGDSSRLLVYYEEAGVPPATRTLAAGENIRAVSMKLLGHPKSWKEIWATNPDIVSKGLISQAVEVRYWPAGSQAGPPPAPPPPPEETFEEEAAPSPDEAAAEELIDEGESLSLEGGEAPPAGEGLDEGDSFVEPPSTKEEDKKIESPPPAAGGGGGGGDGFGEWIVYLVGLLLIALSAGMLIVKKRRKSQDFDYTATGIQQLS